jgi:hypothetical protein
MARARRADGARDPAAPEQQSAIVSAVGVSVHAETGFSAWLGRTSSRKCPKIVLFLDGVTIKTQWFVQDISCSIQSLTLISQPVYWRRCCVAAFFLSKLRRL